VEASAEKIVIIECEPGARESLLGVLDQAGYQAGTADSVSEGVELARTHGASLLLLNADLAGMGCREVLAELKGATAMQGIRVILLVAGGASDRALGLELGADDVVSRPWEPAELLARVRAQLRARRAEAELREKTRIAEEGQQIAHTAFEALAVTEKMTQDAFSLGRVLKVGVSAALVVAAVMAGIFFLYSRRAQKVAQLDAAVIARLESGLAGQQDLVTQARKLREQLDASSAGAPQAMKQQLQQQAEQLQAQVAKAGSDQVAVLQKQLAQTNERLRRVEQEGQVAEGIIRSDAASVCLLRVAVAFRHKASGQRLRYGGINPQGQPLQDSEGNPVLTLEGRGPEVRLDVFGTGFLAAAGGRVVTNRHVVQPWWQNDELQPLAEQGVQGEIAEINAYFPNDSRSFKAEIQEISPQVDLAVVRVDTQDLKRPVLPLDGRKGAAVSGQPVVLMGYATGLAAILARTDEKTAQEIAARSDGNPKQILAELARRNLIHPLVTQGHIGDVLADKIVFDAQTTSGGSGGPLFNQDGKVIGVTYAVLRGFGGSNFGIPIRHADPLLGH